MSVITLALETTERSQSETKSHHSPATVLLLWPCTVEIVVPQNFIHPLVQPTSANEIILTFHLTPLMFL